ncbi:MAG TPA: hypothetical protein VLK58_02220 [Conexibacter sp.]|nr:hypothetical protein [Conexibacter sp.]
MAGVRSPAAAASSPVAHDDAARRRAARGATRREQAPAAPWGSFPLMELCVLSAIALGIAGFVVGGGSGNVLLTGAVLIGSVAGLEVALREHIGGYRSHTALLAGVAAVATMAVLFFVRVDRTTMVPIAIAVFVLAFLGWRALFKKRSGGFGVKVR